MVFKSENFYIDLIQDVDIEGIVHIYNSNEHFLISHMDAKEVTSEWLLEELKDMKDIGFSSYKIIDIKTGKIIGIMDFKLGEETYLSLLIIHSDLQGKGYGKLIFQEFEEYIKSLKSKSIRIDVVTNYNSSVLDFWINNGFVKSAEIELNWSGKVLPAVTMKKIL